MNSTGTNGTNKLLLLLLTGTAAVALFLGGMLWQSRSAHPAQAPTAGDSPLTTNAANAPSDASQPEPPSPLVSGVNAANETKPAAGPADVIVNGRALSADQMNQLRAAYKAAPPPGRYWYDPTSGLWGLAGHEFAGYLQPGLNFGELSPDASAGNTGIFVNRRQINIVEAQFYQRVFGAAVPGHYWLDGRTGNLGYEGDPTPRANLIAAIQQAQPSGRQGPGFWPGVVGGSGGLVGASDGNCSIVSTDSGSFDTPGCR